MTTRREWLTAAAASAFYLSGGRSFAQSVRRVLVFHPAGGPTDIAARSFAKLTQGAATSPFTAIVENRAFGSSTGLGAFQHNKGKDMYVLSGTSLRHLIKQH